MCGHCGCEQQLVDIERDILAENDRYAAQNREFFAAHKIGCINFVASPGAGKTTLLIALINALKSEQTVQVIEGDQHTDLDRQRIAATGVGALQINTGKSCHLDAHRIHHALTEMGLSNESLLFIENVGNLVCPALFDLGEQARVVVLSVTEGDEKPLKYPYMFAEAQVMIVNKIDLLPYVDFDLEHCVTAARRINPNITVFTTSATTGEGITPIVEWLSATSH